MVEVGLMVIMNSPLVWFFASLKKKLKKKQIKKLFFFHQLLFGWNFCNFGSKEKMTKVCAKINYFLYTEFSTESGTGSDPETGTGFFFPKIIF